MLIDANFAIEEAADILNSWRAKRIKTQLPSLEALPEILNEPLAEAEKLTISTEAYEDLISRLYEQVDFCSEADVAVLFKKAKTDTLSPLTPLYTAAVESPSPTGTEDSFHGFWDQNIAKVVKLLLPTGLSIRNSNRHTETRKFRPDSGFLYENICVFRGEEKGSENDEDPKVELSDKITSWGVYEPAPYLLGELYHCECLVLCIHANYRVLLLWAPIDACRNFPAWDREGQPCHHRFSLCGSEASSRSHRKYTAPHQFNHSFQTARRPCAS